MGKHCKQRDDRQKKQTNKQFDQRSKMSTKLFRNKIEKQILIVSSSAKLPSLFDVASLKTKKNNNNKNRRNEETITHPPPLPRPRPRRRRSSRSHGDQISIKYPNQRLVRNSTGDDCAPRESDYLPEGIVSPSPPHK